MPCGNTWQRRHSRLTAGTRYWHHISCLQGTQQQTSCTLLLLSIDGTDEYTNIRPVHRPCSTYYGFLSQNRQQYDGTSLLDIKCQSITLEVMDWHFIILYQGATFHHTVVDFVHLCDQCHSNRTNMTNCSLIKQGNGLGVICPPANNSSTVAKSAADLRPSADGTAVRTSLVAGGG